MKLQNKIHLVLVLLTAFFVNAQNKPKALQQLPQVKLMVPILLLITAVHLLKKEKYGES